jgi:hypothetical protein
MKTYLYKTMSKQVAAGLYFEFYNDKPIIDINEYEYLGR